MSELVEDDDATETSFWKAAKVSAWLLLAALILLLVSAVVADDFVITRHVLRDVGIGVIVAAVIIFTIEQRSKDELNRMVSRFLKRTHENLFQTILGVEFPKPMFEFVRDRLMKEPVFRTQTEIHYTIRPLSDNAGSRWEIPTVLLDCAFSYRIKNLSDREQVHPIRFFVEEPLDDNAQSDKQHPHLEVDGVEVSDDQVRHADKAWKDRPGLRRFEYDLKMAPKEERFVSLRHRMTKLIADTECWRTLHPCDGARFSVTHPVELSVGVDAMHPDDLTTIQDNEASFVGMIARPLFPANGFLFWWHPRDGGMQVPEKKQENQLNPDATHVG